MYSWALLSHVPCQTQGHGDMLGMRCPSVEHTWINYPVQDITCTKHVQQSGPTSLNESIQH